MLVKWANGGIRLICSRNL